MILAPATVADVAALAQAHAAAFAQGWSAEDFADLLQGSGVFGFIARDDRAQGLVLCRIAADEMEVLTLGVALEARRRGLAKALMAAALGAARQAGAAACFLEVAVDNQAAIGLYRSLGFHQAGVRRGYYGRGEGALIDALVMRLDLNAATS